MYIFTCFFLLSQILLYALLYILFRNVIFISPLFLFIPVQLFDVILLRKVKNCEGKSVGDIFVRTRFY